MKSDQTFIQIFLDFLNDKTANGERFEANLRRHRYVMDGEKQGFPFNSARGIDFKPLQRDMVGLLHQWKDGASVGFQRRIVGELNRLALVIRMVDLATKKPLLGPDGDEVTQRIVALATFQFGDNGVEFGGQPIVNGLEYACWYALLLVSRIPGKVGRCIREGCGQWYNRDKTRTLGFCSADCSRKHNKEMQRRRQYNRRHPEDPKPIIRATNVKARRH